MNHLASKIHIIKNSSPCLICVMTDDHPNSTKCFMKNKLTFSMNFDPVVSLGSVMMKQPQNVIEMNQTNRRIKVRQVATALNISIEAEHTILRKRIWGTPNFLHARSYANWQQITISGV